MTEWLKDRWEILRLTLKHPLPFLALGFFQAAALALGYFHPPFSRTPWLNWLVEIPWYAWALAWLAALWFSTLDYSVERKKRFDETSVNFFKAYLDHLVKEGHQLFQFAGEKDFYSRISHWQRKIIEGVAIGLGHGESGKFFHKMEAQSPLSEAYRQSQASKSDEPLSRAIQARLDELGQIRLSLPERDGEGKELALGEEGPAGRVPVKPAGLLTGGVEPPPSKRLPPK
jgi:hypothetical protein